MKGSWIQHEIVRDTTQKSEKHELIRVVSRTVSSSILGILATLNFLSNSVYMQWIKW